MSNYQTVGDVIYSSTTRDMLKNRLIDWMVIYLKAEILILRMKKMEVANSRTLIDVKNLESCKF